MNITELKAKIEKMEAGLNNPNIQGEAKAALEKALEKAKAQLKEMEEAQAPNPPKEDPEPAQAKKEKPPKPLPQRRSRVKTPAPTRKVAYSWKNKTDIKKLQPIVNHCQHYAIEVKEPMQVGIKGKGSGTRKVDVLPGEWLIFDDKGFLVYVMDEGSFKAKCIYKTTVEQHQQQKHKTEEVAKLQKKIEQLEKENKAMEEKTKTPIPTAPAEKVTTPKAKSSSSKKAAKKEDKKPKAKAPKKDVKKPPTKESTSSLSTVENIEKEINDVLKASGKPVDSDQFKAEFNDLKEKGDKASFIKYIKARLKEEDNLSKAQVIKLGVAIRPLYQSFPGAVRDVQSKNKKVLEPTYINLLRWAENPGNYDLQGVDAPKKAKATVKARKPKPSSVLEFFGIG